MVTLLIFLKGNLTNVSFLVLLQFVIPEYHFLLQLDMSDLPYRNNKIADSTM